MVGSVPRVSVRLVALADVAALTRLVVRSRPALAPWEPHRPDSHFTEAGQVEAVTEVLAAHRHGSGYPGLVLVDGEPAGRVNLSNVVLGAFRSATLGYWIDVEHQGRGVATAAVGAILRTAFDELGLHRVQAGTLLHNHASRRVLAKNGFTEIGVAPRYLFIAGRWQDHLLHQRLADDPS